jgi:hypothetical protein
MFRKSTTLSLALLLIITGFHAYAKDYPSSNQPHVKTSQVKLGALGAFFPIMCQVWGYDSESMTSEQQKAMGFIIADAEKAGIDPALVTKVSLDPYIHRLVQVTIEQVKLKYGINEAQDEQLHRLTSRELMFGLFSKNRDVDLSRRTTLAIGFLKEAKDLFEGKHPSVSDWDADKQGVVDALVVMSQSNTAPVQDNP